MTTIKKLIQSLPIKNILDSFRRVGGCIEIRGNKIILSSKIIPVFVVKTYAKNIRKADIKKQLKVLVR